MRITASQLRKIIKEEVSRMLAESEQPPTLVAAHGHGGGAYFYLVDSEGEYLEDHEGQVIFPSSAEMIELVGTEEQKREHKALTASMRKAFGEDTVPDQDQYDSIRGDEWIDLAKKYAAKKGWAFDEKGNPDEDWM